MSIKIATKISIQWIPIIHMNYFGILQIKKKTFTITITK